MHTLEVYAELTCPFAHVELRRFVEERARRAAAGGPILRVRSWPLEVVNGRATPAEQIAEEVEALQERVAPDLFARFDGDWLPPTSMAPMALAEAAYATGDDGLGEAVSLDLRWRLFEEGADLADPGVLMAIATAHGIPFPGDDSAVHASLEAGKALGIEGSPTWIAGDELLFAPTLHVGHVDELLRVRTDPGGTETFSALAFA